MTALTTGTTFPNSRACTFECGEFYEGGPRAGRTSLKWFAISESLRNTVIFLSYLHKVYFDTELLNDFHIDVLNVNWPTGKHIIGNRKHFYFMHSFDSKW
jgi:hypothetical protein